MTGLEEQLIEALTVMMGQINDLTMLTWAVPLVVILVALVKRIPLQFIQNISAGAIHMTFQVGIWAVYALFVKYDMGDQFQEWTEAAVVILETLLPLIASVFGATWLYDKARTNAIPLLGFERPKA